MTVTDTAERWLPPRLAARVEPYLDRADAILFARDDLARAQRMSLIAFAIRVISAAIAFVSQIILARIMGQFEYGIFVFVWVMVIILGNLSCLGFHTTVIRFLPQYSTVGDLPLLRGLAATARIAALAVASVLAAVGIGGLFLFGDLIESYYLIPLYLGAFALPMIALGDVLDGTARANGWPVNALSPTYIIRPLLILAAMGIAVLSGAEHTARVALIAALCATYLTTLGQFLVVTGRLRKRYERGPLSIAIKTWLLVALPVFLIEGFYFLLTNADVVIVGMFLEPDKVAVYFAAAKTMALVHFVYFAVKAGSAPRFSQLVAAGDDRELAHFAAQTSRWTFWPSLAVGGAVIALGPFLLSLFGPSFGAGVSVMAVLFAGIMAKALIGPGEVLLMMAGRQTICVWVYAGALAVNIGLNIALIPLYGLHGAAAATAVAMATEAVLLHVAARRTLGISLFALSRGVA